jgi:Uma2 family endonuclease
MATATRLITAGEYARLPDRGVPTELVRGEVVETHPPYVRHGRVCSRITRVIGRYLDENDTGDMHPNDAGIVTGRDSDAVRGGDVWYAGYQTFPNGPVPDDYLPVPQDFVFEVLSRDDRWPRVCAEVAEYLAVGAAVVCVVDPRDETVRLYFPDAPEMVLTAADEPAFPNQLPGCSVLVQRLLE